MTHVNFLHVLVAAVAAMAVGAVWYSPALFAKPWMQLTGRKDMTPGEGATQGYIVAFVAVLVTAYILARFMVRLGVDSAMGGLDLGIGAWLGFNAPSFLTTYVFSNRPLKLWAIDSLQYLATFVVMGLILGAWH